MKKYLLPAIAAFLFISAPAQFRKIPSEVTKALETKYPSASQISWKDNVSNFEASFSDHTYEMTAQFNSKGAWLESTTKIPKEHAPGEVLDGLKKSKYADWETGEHTYKIERPKDYIRYRFRVTKGIEKKYLYFNKKGKLEKEALTI